MWYFVVLSVLGIAAITINWVYNVLQQLRPEQLAAARALWEQTGPKDYDLTYVSTDEEKPGMDATAGPADERVLVRVRNGRVESATRNAQDLSPNQAEKCRVEGLFDLIAGYLEQDSQPGGPSTYAHALFDKKDGHPIHYVRRVMGSRQRLEIRIELNLPGQPPGRTPALPQGR